ncbi:MAG: universal stress protein [Pyrinomonadaceae bacterium]
MKVLIATEGSKFSQAAIDKFCNMFDESENTEIRIISAVEPAYAPPESFNVSAEYTRELDAASRKHANEVISQASEEIRRRVPSLANNLTTKVVTGPPERAIVKEAEDWKADVIFVGSHGYAFWKKALLGSVSSSVVHHAPCSVVIVRTPKTSNSKNS